MLGRNWALMSLLDFFYSCTASGPWLKLDPQKRALFSLFLFYFSAFLFLSYYWEKSPAIHTFAATGQPFFLNIFLQQQQKLLIIHNGFNETFTGRLYTFSIFPRLTVSFLKLLAARRSQTCVDYNPCEEGGVCMYDSTLEKSTCKCRKGLHGTLCEKGQY